MRIQTANLPFGTAQKTAQIRAKPLLSLIDARDTDVLAFLTLETLEGQQAIQQGAGVMVCTGPANDFWQQPVAKLMKAYEVTHVEDSGWMVCTPRPESVRNFWQVPEDVEVFTILAQCGDEIPNPVEVGGYTYRYEQTGAGGSYILQSQEDPHDFWIVEKKLFENTYNVLVSCGVAFVS